MRRTVYFAATAVIIGIMVFVVVCAVIYVDRKSLSDVKDRQETLISSDDPLTQDGECAEETENQEEQDEEDSTAGADESEPYDRYLTTDDKKWYVLDISGNETGDFWEITRDGSVYSGTLKGYDESGTQIVITAAGPCDIMKDISENVYSSCILSFDAGAGNYYTCELSGTDMMTVHWPDGSIQACRLDGHQDASGGG